MNAPRTGAARAPATADPDALANPALKEWAAIWDAIARGEQVVDLRKGGLREEGHRFRVRASRFWLYDSYEHQRADLLRPRVRDRLPAIDGARPADGALRFTAWAELAAAATLTEPAQLAALDAEFAWTAAYAEQRLHWRPKQPLWLLVLRAHRLREPLTVPLRDGYAGCSSWVPMTDLPADPALAPSDPVLDDAAFAARLRALHDALPGVTFSEPAAVLE